MFFGIDLKVKNDRKRLTIGTFLFGTRHRNYFLEFSRWSVLWILVPHLLFVTIGYETIKTYTFEEWGPAYVIALSQLVGVTFAFTVLSWENMASDLFLRVKFIFATEIVAIPLMAVLHKIFVNAA